MKKIKLEKLIERIEGEAKLNFTLDDSGLVEDSKISFNLYRGIENILIGKNPLDALIITPRVCGICNHSHLIASVRALESGYRSLNPSLKLNSKIEKIREFTLGCEIIQNHIKWLYLTILPELESGFNREYPVKASYISSTIVKALSIFAGQWPHSSYAIPFGVTCDPTYFDIIEAENLIDEVTQFFEKVVIGIDLDNFLDMKSIYHISKIDGDFKKLITLLIDNRMEKLGKSYDRFITLGECFGFKTGKFIPTKVSNIDIRYVTEYKQQESVSKGVIYKNRHYETGAIARGMISKLPIVKALHKRYRDSTLTRAFARIYEIGVLLKHLKEILNSIDLSFPSLNHELPKAKYFSGIGAIEASRGSLIHKISVKNSKIANYEIITPTQWNISNGNSGERGIANRAMQRCTPKEAQIIFKSFDICSVCTVH